MLGIDSLKKLILFACNFTKEIADSLKDGKIQMGEIFNFMDEIMSIPGVVKSFPAIMQEIKDLTINERNELEQYIKAQFDLNNDQTESVIENSLAFAFSAIALVEQWKALNKR